MDNATSFGTQAKVYAAARPSYPDKMFDWIAAQAPATKTVWDVGTGSGQAALSLSSRFALVHGTDIDAAQLAQARQHPNISYTQAPAHQSRIATNSVDAVTVATALHWFDFDLFWPEVKRVARPGAIFCAWTYHRSETDKDVERLLLDPILDVIAPYWSDGNRLSWRGYGPEEIGIPFKVINMPEFKCELIWRPPQIAALVRSWSAHKKARHDGHGDILAKIETDALAKLDDSPRIFNLPLNTLAAKIV